MEGFVTGQLDRYDSHTGSEMFTRCVDYMANVHDPGCWRASREKCENFLPICPASSREIKRENFVNCIRGGEKKSI